MTSSDYTKLIGELYAMQNAAYRAYKDIQEKTTKQVVELIKVRNALLVAEQQAEAEKAKYLTAP